ncbi:TPA: hypothetical protein DCE37_24020, partial [Candidatus Latescibacteria bacterium]|nr:hypothetical protein [Candidatus Latescibacterota bacterium]
MSISLTAEQKQSWADDGFLILRDTFSKAELDRVAAGVLRAVKSGNCYSGRGGQLLPIDSEESYPMPETMYTVEGQYQDDPDLLFMAEHPAVLGPVEELLGGPACLSAFISYLKTPGARGTWGDYQGSHPTGHCDYKTYHQAGSSLNWLFAIVPLVDLDEETGPLLVSPGSHKVSRIVPLNDRVSRVERASASDIAPLVDAELRRGDLLFMSMFTWHEGGANGSDHDRFGLYNKYRALDAPPACGPQLFSERTYHALSEKGKRLVPHHSDLPFTEAGLIVEHDGKVLLMARDHGGWQLPGAPASIDSPTGQGVTSKLIGQLEVALLDSLGVEIPWMTFVADYFDANGVRRVYAYSGDEGAIAEAVSGPGFRWVESDGVTTLVEAEELGR